MQFKTMLIVLVLLIHISCKQTKDEPTFELDGVSILQLTNNSNDSLSIQLKNWYIWPSKAQRIDTIIAANESIDLELTTQGYTYNMLVLNKKPYQIFSRPGSTNNLSFNSGEIVFSGDLKGINEFLAKKTNYFKTVNSDFAFTGQALTEVDISYERFNEMNDSITQVLTHFLVENESSIPNWYFEFERKRLKYSNAHRKINKVLYNKLMLYRDDTIPQNFMEDIVATVNIEDETLLGNIDYMMFLNNYMAYRSNYPFNGKKGAGENERFMHMVDNELSGIVKDGFLAFSKLGSINDASWIKLIEDPKFLTFIDQNYKTDSVLPKGAQLPYFYLPDTSNNYYEPNNFINQVVLINFWSTGCKPCIMDFPDDNILVEKYKNEPVAILNICTATSKPDTWKRLIEKYNLKTINLIAEGNWNKKLIKDFDINGLPHSVLVDWNGVVVQNKCQRASSNIDEQIDQLLAEMKKEGNIR